MCPCVCVCVCVRERESERERMKEREKRGGGRDEWRQVRRERKMYFQCVYVCWREFIK